MIVCVAIVGQQNNPLYIRVFPPVDADQQLKFHYVVHCSLDAIEEKVLLKRNPGETPDLYLGLLYPTEDFKVYGYISNTNTKFLVVLLDSIIKDEAVSKVLKRLHNQYVELVLNPFHTPGLPIKSNRFDSAVDQVVQGYAVQGLGG